MAKHKPARVVYIRWMDTVRSAAGWTTPSDLTFNKLDMSCESVGFLLKENKFSYALVANKSVEDSNEMLHVIQIPKSVVLEFKELSSGRTIMVAK